MNLRAATINKMADRVDIRKPITDSWYLKSTIRGIQIQKNDRNVCFATSFEKAWEYIQNNGTSGDHIRIDVDGVLG